MLRRVYAGTMSKRWFEGATKSPAQRAEATKFAQRDRLVFQNEQGAAE